MSVATIQTPRATTAPFDHTTAGDLVRAAARLEDGAWNALVERFDGMVRSIARSHGLGGADVADVSQVVWMQLVDHVGTVRDPDRVAGWLATTTRHECLRTLRQHRRTTPTADPDVLESSEHDADPAAALVARQRDAVLSQLIGTLPSRHQALLQVMMVEPRPSNREAAWALGIPVGSIGPTRQRCLALLRSKCAAAGITP